MAALSKRWYRSRRNQLLIFIFILGILAYSSIRREPDNLDLDITKRFIDNKLQEQLKLDKGTGCEIPVLDPFAWEVTRFDKTLPKIVCEGQDWVKCYLSECRVIEEVLRNYSHVSCTYKDIIYVNDDKYTISGPVEVKGSNVYHLNRSDHVKVSCTGSKKQSCDHVKISCKESKNQSCYHIKNSCKGSKKQSFLNIIPGRWSGYAAGMRSKVARQPPPVGREHTLNVLIFAFDSTARNGFIRRMPKSYKFLTEELKASILKGYNIVGDGTPAALFPILTGKNELELPDVRKKLKSNKKSVDEMPFIFYKLKDDGYRTAYLEDMPWIGTFQYRFNGFRHQPADHYLRSFFQEESLKGKRWWKGSKYCVGDTPRYELMMNLTNQFFHLDGKKFAFTFVADITHDDFNQIPSADEDFVRFLERFRSDGFLKDTMLLVMGDHGPRYSNVRNTYQGKLEERLPLMAITLPEKLKAERPTALPSLQLNVDALTTPHDIHATILDAMDMRKYWNPYKITGADLPRGMTLLEPIPRNRSCSEAGIEPHWCACLSWQNVSHNDPMYTKASGALLDHINSLTKPVRAKCAVRTLSTVSWVLKQRANSRMLAFVEAKDNDGYVGKFGKEVQLQKETYQVKISVGPGRGDYEASMTYFVDKDEFHVDNRDISRTNMYGSEPDCISKTHPHLNPYCYCSH